MDGRNRRPMIFNGVLILVAYCLLSFNYCTRLRDMAGTKRYKIDSVR